MDYPCLYDALGNPPLDVIGSCRSIRPGCHPLYRFLFVAAAGSTVGHAWVMSGVRGYSSFIGVMGQIGKGYR